MTKIEWKPNIIINWNSRKEIQTKNDISNRKNNTMTTEERSTEVPGLVSANNSARNASTIISSIAQSWSFNIIGRGWGNQRGGRYHGRSRYNSYIRAPMKGMNNDLTILKSTSEGPRKDQFIQFQLELKQYILKEFTSPDDIAKIVKDLEDPSDNLNEQMPRIENIKIKSIIKGSIQM